MEWGDDVEIADTDCPRCGHFALRCDCYGVGCEDGQIDGYEYDDPLWFSPGETFPCSTCDGFGYFHWCPACGLDLRGLIAAISHTENRVSPDAQPETLRALAEVGRRLWNWLAHLPD